MYDKWITEKTLSLKVYTRWHLEVNSINYASDTRFKMVLVCCLNFPLHWIINVILKCIYLCKNMYFKLFSEYSYFKSSSLVWSVWLTMMVTRMKRKKKRRMKKIVPYHLRRDHALFYRPHTDCWTLPRNNCYHTLKSWTDHTLGGVIIHPTVS